MRKIKITKNIVDKNAWIMGLSKKQIAVGAVGAAVAGFSLYLMWGKLPTQLMMTIVFVELMIVVLVGFIKVNGMSIVSMLIASFKKKVRTYHSRKDGIYGEKEK